MIDDVDRHILDLLRRNARMTTSEIAREVGLTATPVARRIGRMERTGVIRGYAALVDESQMGDLEAFAEIRLKAETDSAQIEEIARQVPEVQNCYTIAGDPDALVRFRVRNVDHLQQVVNSIRRTGVVAGTKTLIVMASWDRSKGDVPER